MSLLKCRACEKEVPPDCIFPHYYYCNECQQTLEIPKVVVNKKLIDDLVKYVMKKADQSYADDFPISNIENWIRDFFNKNPR